MSDKENIKNNKQYETLLKLFRAMEKYILLEKKYREELSRLKESGNVDFEKIAKLRYLIKKAKKRREALMHAFTIELIIYLAENLPDKKEKT